MGNDLRQLILKLGIRQRNRLGESGRWSVLFVIVVSQPEPHPLPARDRGHVQFDRT
jgi:hypothetical protein